ncbi:cell division protein FtsI [Corynebacterium sp. HMSC071F07]|uniref:penicillin-binding transpeptidase domain-containing protein n=1 Tax=Corynebacterium sp. HMSC071F07 TaxID=1715203 RepID=UPI0008A3274B|nr:penicillin-binding transpeptidase domain-containing protein [Corynebacterium sp. HMSC071F07]OFM03064.1 cell division protein FtsI [Corynebacterium sp. HMSC071F07]
MRKMVALLCAASFGASSLVACTPKPVSAEPVAEKFIADMEARNNDELATLVDNPDATTSTLDATYSGLQAEGLDIELGDVPQDDSHAAAKYKVTWDLPKDRTLSYDTEMTLTKKDKDWQGRWQPSLVHPNLGAHQHLELRAIDAKRASVVSSDGVELLSPGLQYRVVVDKEKAGDMRPLAAKISSALNQAHAQDDSVPEKDAGELAKELEGSEGNSYSVTMLNEAQAEQVRPQLEHIEGVRLNEEPAMVTRETGLAPDILARVRSIVSDEVEGNSGWSISVVNENGAALSDVELHQPEESPSIRVGLDYNVQRAAQEAVNMRADSEAMLVAIRPSNGEILAVAQTEQADKKGDIALQGQFPPGSVFKIITASAAVDKQGATADTIVPCPGTMNLFGRTVTNYNGFSLGSVPMRQAFAQSCNTTFAEVSTNLKEGELAKTGKEFGLGIDYDIPGLTTITGSIPEGKTPLERTEAGYGQGADLASPFGMALVSATVAAGKTPMPTLLSNHKTKASEDAPAPDPHVLENVRDMMRAVVTGGTASGMQAGGTIYGKTGEAEINEGSHAWFTGYREDDIAFATLVVLGGGSDTSVNITDNFLQKLDAYRAEGNGSAPAPQEGE